MNGENQSKAYEPAKESESVRMAKEALRRKIWTEARALPGEIFLREGAKIAKKLESLPELRDAGTVFCFVSTVFEADTHGLIQKLLDAGKRVAVPRCKGDGVMEAYVIHSLSELCRGHYGIQEPSDAAELILPEQIELALIPALACGQDGSRLGQGGGYYDRYLMRAGAVRAALCRDACLFPSIPVSPHDCKMDLIVTETRLFHSFQR